jgi:hypothetical protein
MTKETNPNREKARSLARQIAGMTDEQKAQWMARVPILTMDRRPLSGKNHMLVAMQCADATMVGGFRQWLAAGRAVRKGETAIYIFVPSSARSAPGADAETGGADAGGAETVRFLMAPVFDVSQTDAIEIAATAAAA